MTLPQTFDAGDCLTFDRDLALEATRHILIAMKLLLEAPSLRDDVHLDQAVCHVSQMLGGDHWREIAQELVDSFLEEEAAES